MTYGGLGPSPYEEPVEREPPKEERRVPPVVPTEPREEREIPDVPYTVKDPYTGKDIDLVLKQGMFLWREDKLEGFFTKRGDFITTRPEETEPWERTRAFFSNIWRSLPVNPYFWKSPEAKWEADRKDALLAWAKEADIENPEEYVKDLLAKETKELAWEAYEPEEGRLRIPEFPIRPTGEKVTVGERFVGEWVIPMTVLSMVGVSAIKGRAALEAAKVKPALVIAGKEIIPAVAKPAVTRAALEAGRVALAPVAGAEWVTAKIFTTLFGRPLGWVKGKLTQRQMVNAFHKSRAYNNFRAQYPKVTPARKLNEAELFRSFQQYHQGNTVTAQNILDHLVREGGIRIHKPGSRALVPYVVKPGVKPPVRVAPPKVAPPTVPPIKPPTGIRYAFNLKKFRFEPQPIELKLGVSPEVNKLTNLVKSAKPARELTEALKHEELSKRVGAAAATAKATGAQKAAFAAMAKLKGELPTAAFTPPEAGLTEGEIAALYNQVKSELLVENKKFFKWLNTDAALRKLLSGNIPTRGEIELLENMFGSELAGAILAKRPISEKIWELTVDTLNIPRAILASFDFSAWLRQGAFIVTAYPKIGAKALAVDLRTFFSGKYTMEIDAAIRAGKFAQLREDAGLYLAPIEEGVAVRLAAREEAFMTRLVRKIPILGIGVRLSERAYISTLNYMRASTFDYYAAKWENMDYPMKTYKQLATLIGWATGRGPIGKLGAMVPVINNVFFAARLQTSRVGMLFAGPAKFTSPPVRKAYIRMMLAFFGSMSAIVALLELTGVATTNTDPRSTDFGKIRIGNTRLDPWAGFRPIVTVLARAITGQRKTTTGREQDISRQETLTRFMRSKAAPAMGLIWDILKGETYLGEEMTLETEGLREQFYQRLTPLFIQDMIDAINEEGWVGGFSASPGVLGVGVVTYPGSIDAYERHVIDIPEEMLMDWQRGIILSGEPLTYQNLNVVQKSWLIRHCETIGDIPERREPGQFNFYEAERETREELEVKLDGEIAPVVASFWQGEITIADYITQSDHLRNKYFGPAAYLWRDSMREKLDPLLHKNLAKWQEEEIKPGDKAYDEYMDIRTDPPTKAGIPDWDAWADKLKDFLSQQTTEISDYIEARQQSWIDNLPPARQKIERLIVICEEVLDDYYAQPEGKDRTTYRERNPDVDVKLNLLGKVTTTRSDNALIGLMRWAKAWGIPYSSIPALAEEAPPVSVTPPREEGLGPSPYE